jgi:hypothetical protein
MTDCTTEPLLFSSLKRQNIQADFRGGRLTSDGGALLLREADRSLGLIDAINACIFDPRNPFFIAHSQRTLLAQRIFGIALGYEDLNDHQSLREDPLFQVLSERGVRADLPLASPPTGAAAYLLVDSLRRQALSDTEWAQAQVDAIRLKLLKIGARVICSVRRAVIHLAEIYPQKDLFAHILGRLRALPACSPASG